MFRTYVPGIALDPPEDTHGDHLYDGEQVNSTELHKFQENVVWLILGRHEQQEYSIEELEAS